jgi:hypothetical protein
MNVIFDTNPYRYLASGKTPEQVKAFIPKLRNAEAALEITAWVAPTVWLELFYHLGDPSGRNYADCLAAVVACYLHTRAKDGQQFRLMPRAGMLQAYVLFGHKDEKEDDLLSALDYITGELCQMPSQETIQKYDSELGRIREFVQTQENAFMERFEKAKQGVAKDDSLQLMYLGLAQVVATSIGIHPELWSAAEKEKWTRKVELNFPAPFQLYLEIRKRYIENPKLDITTGSKRNWFWDNDMLFYISKNVPNVLVTDDKAIHIAASRAGLADKTKRLVDYLREINLDLEELRG